MSNLKDTYTIHVEGHTFYVRARDPITARKEVLSFLQSHPAVAMNTLNTEKTKLQAIEDYTGTSCHYIGLDPLELFEELPVLA